MKRHSGFLILLIMAYPLIFSGCSNIFSDISEKGFYKAVLFEANQQVNEGKYTAAIDTINNGMDDVEKATAPVRWVLAKAYAGACGMDAIQQLIDLGDLSTSTLFEIFLTEFQGTTTTKEGYCDQAVTTGMTFGTAPNRKSIQNYLMFFASWAKLGTYLSLDADVTLVDGSVDAGFDPCDNNDLDQARVDELVTAFGNMYTSLSALIADGMDGVSDLSTLEVLCTTIDTVDPTYNICSIVNLADVTDPHRVTMRCLVDGPDVGFSVSGNDIVTCIDDAGGNAVCPP